MVRYQYNSAGFVKWRGASGRYDSGFLVKLLRDMLRIRTIEEEIEKRTRGSDEDSDSSGDRTGSDLGRLLRGVAHGRSPIQQPSPHGNYLAKGGDLKAMLCEMFCRINGCVGSRGGSMHLIDKRVGMAGTSAIVAGAIPIATGAALAAQIQKLDRATVVFLGDAGTEEGAASESLNFAALNSCDVFFFCENNFYSVQSPRKRGSPSANSTQVGPRLRNAGSLHRRHECPRGA